jgi:hypothetical protein
MNITALEYTARMIAAGNIDPMAMDENTPTCNKRFAAFS